MVTQGGALIVKMLKRTASLEAKDPNPGPPKGQLGKLNVPKKTKVFVDQTIRERENAIGESVRVSLGLECTACYLMHIIELDLE